MKQMKQMKQTVGEKIFDFINIVFFIAFAITIVYPFVFQINLSLSTPRGALFASRRLLPMKGEITLIGYKMVFQNPRILWGFYNSIWRCVVGTVLSVVFTYMMAYPLSKKYLLFKNFWTGWMIFTMFFSGGLIPSYLLVRSLGLMDSRWVLVLPGLISAFNVVLVRNYIQSIPDSLEESARLEGANDAYILYKIIVPLSKPIMATIALWIIVGHWNAWFDAMLYIRSSTKQVLQILLRNTIQGALSGAGGGEQIFDQILQKDKESVTPASLQAALLIVVTIPIICVYPFLQKHFVKGIMIGSLKG